MGTNGNGNDGARIECFLLDDALIRVSDIKALRIDGGPNGHGCWADIQLRGRRDSICIGDGSYYGDGKHRNHRCARLPDGKPDFGFTILRRVMREMLANNDGAKARERT